MSIRRNSEKIQIGMNPYNYGQINSQSDYRVKMIYDRYRAGKCIIIDDLKYLWLKDPEGYEKLAKNIVESITSKGLEITSNNMVNIGYVKVSTESTNDQQSRIEHTSSPDTPMDTLSNILDAMTSVKIMIDKMSESELMDMMDNLNESLALKKLNHNIKDWDDTLVDKMVMYTYDEEKAFDILA